MLPSEALVAGRQIVPAWTSGDLVQIDMTTGLPIAACALGAIAIGYGEMERLVNDHIDWDLTADGGFGPFKLEGMPDFWWPELPDGEPMHRYPCKCVNVTDEEVPLSHVVAHLSDDHRRSKYGPGQFDPWTELDILNYLVRIGQ